MKAAAGDATAKKAKALYSHVDVKTASDEDDEPLVSAATHRARADDSDSDEEDGRSPHRERFESPLAAQRRLWLVSSLGGVGALFLLLVYMIVHGNRLRAVRDGATMWEALPEAVVARMDKRVDPCEDFYTFSCGSWVRNTEIPADKTGVFLSFTTVDDRNEQVLHEVVQEKWPYVGELFDSCMNMTAINATGFAPLKPMLEAIDKTETKAELFQLAGQLSQTGPNFLTALSVDADEKDATTYALYASQAGLSLPDPAYYLDEDKFEDVSDAFHEFVATLFTLVGWDQNDAKENADMIIEFEKKLASLFVPKEELKDPTVTYNLVKVSDAVDTYPLLFGAFVNGTGILANLTKASASVIVETPAYFAATEQLVTNASASLDTLQVLLTYHYLRSFATKLSDPFIDAVFAFYGQKLSGQKQRRERWKVCLDYVTGNFPDLMGKYYFIKQFDAEGEHLAAQLVSQIETVMGKKLAKLDWLDDETRQQAIWKLGNVSNLIGHSTRFEHLPFVLSSDGFTSNMETLAQYQFERAVNRLGNQVDRDEWFMSGAEVNAYYNPSTNQIVFPAGILQPPFFDRRNHPARNFGAIGSIIGHELTHGFDDSGRYYSGDGNLVNWWSDATTSEFQQRATCLVDQYSSFEVVSAFDDSKVLGPVNGNFTLGENIADNGGVKLAFRAFKQAMVAKNQDEEDENRQQVNLAMPSLSSVNADKLFFVSFAQAFCAKSSDEAMTRRLATDPHSPEKWRVNGAMMNSIDFARTFDCPAGAAMNPESKCQLW